MGRKKQPHYRVVVAESRKARDGRFVETLGYYKPLSDPARLVLDLERVDYWIGQGALPSDTVGNLITKARAGGDDTVAVGEVDTEAERAKRVEELAAKRAAEKKAAEEAAKAEEEAKKAAEAKAAEEAEAAEEESAEDAGETEPAAEAEDEGEAAEETSE
jgi:small subunit ribosomal protein S16